MGQCLSYCDDFDGLHEKNKKHLETKETSSPRRSTAAVQLKEEEEEDDDDESIENNKVKLSLPPPIPPRKPSPITIINNNNNNNNNNVEEEKKDNNNNNNNNKSSTITSSPWKKITDLQLSKETNLLKFKVELLTNMLAIEKREKEVAIERLEAIQIYYRSKYIVDNELSSSITTVRESNLHFELEEFDAITLAISNFRRDYITLKDDIINTFSNENGTFYKSMQPHEFIRKLYSVSQKISKADANKICLKFYDGESVNITDFINFFDKYDKKIPFFTSNHEEDNNQDNELNELDDSEIQIVNDKKIPFFTSNHEEDNNQDNELNKLDDSDIQIVNDNNQNNTMNQDHIKNENNDNYINDSIDDDEHEKMEEKMEDNQVDNENIIKIDDESDILIDNDNDDNDNVTINNQIEIKDDLDKKNLPPIKPNRNSFST